MKKNSLVKIDDMIYRILDEDEGNLFIINCSDGTMPKWIPKNEFGNYEELGECEFGKQEKIEELGAKERTTAYNRYAMIAQILKVVSNERMRCDTLARVSEENNVSKKTLRKYLCLYLVYQNVAALAPQKHDKTLTKNEKNMRWALNKFFYTKNKNSLKTAYTFMLKEKYCDTSGTLLSEYPSFHQFRYFYRKHKSIQTYYISRNGLTNYQRNNRPLTGNGIQEFAPSIGFGMLDATVCDIYLVNEAGSIIGRPILTACVDAFSGLCCGYSLSWEGGVYSLRNLMMNVIADKVEWCKRFGISIQEEDWNCRALPGVLVTDKGAEYISETFEQIAELGVRVINLPSYRPELKGAVEKFFDLVQEEYKKHLKGKGVIEPDFNERGAHDYRLDACLTMESFEKIILHCIIYYNTGRVVESFPYTPEMINDSVQPFSCSIWNWEKEKMGDNLIEVSSQQLILALLPRKMGKFSRSGLRVNNLRYHKEKCTEMYLKGDTAVVAYNPDDVSCVWLIENGKYTQFDLIEERFKGKKLEDVQALQNAQKQIVKKAIPNNLQAQINLAEHIQVISEAGNTHMTVKMKDIRSTRRKEQGKRRVDFMKEAITNV